MQHNITYGELYAINSDIREIETKNPGANMLLYSKIKLFRERARMSNLILQKNIKEIQKKYIEHDEKDNAKYSPDYDPKKDPDIKWLYRVDVIDPETNEPMTAEAAEKAYSEELEKFLKSTTKIDF